jgi:hypothetical protein
MTATLVRRGVEHEITILPDRIGVAPGIEVELLGPLAVKIAAEVDDALHRPAFDSAAFDGDGDFRVMPGANRHVGWRSRRSARRSSLICSTRPTEDAELLAMLGDRASERVDQL